MRERQASAGPRSRFGRRRLLQLAGGAAAFALAACEDTAPPPPAPSPAPRITAAPATRRPTVRPAASPPAEAIDRGEVLPVIQKLELAVAWPARTLGSLAENLGSTRWRISITPAAAGDVDGLRGPAAGADLVSPGDPKAMARAGDLELLPPGAGRSGWHPAALATGNDPAVGVAALPLGVRARVFTYRSDLLAPPADLTAWRSSAAALTRHDDRFVRFAGIDLAPAAHDPRWLVFGGRECGPGGCYSRRGVELFRSLFADPGIAFRRDFPRTDWPASALAAGAAATGLSDWARIRRRVKATPLQARLATATAPLGLGALEGGGRFWLAAPRKAGSAGLEALADLDLPRLSAAVAASADMFPADAATLAEMAGEDSNLDPLLDPELRLYDWRSSLGPSQGALAGLMNRALALGPRPVEELIERFEQAGVRDQH